jgi:hypothetical protein
MDECAGAQVVGLLGRSRRRFEDVVDVRIVVLVEDVEYIALPLIVARVSGTLDPETMRKREAFEIDTPN